MDDVWKKIQKEYIKGASQRTLAKKYSVSRDAICKRVKAGKWTAMRGQVQAKVMAKAAEAAVDEAAMMHDFGSTLMAKAIEGLKDCPPDDVMALKGYAQIGRDARAILDIRSEADLKEQEARILKLRAEAEEREREQDGGGMIIQLGGDVDEYGG